MVAWEVPFLFIPHLRPQYDIFVGLDTINWPTKFNKIILQKNANQFKPNHLISNLVKFYLPLIYHFQGEAIGMAGVAMGHG